jgi:16S rRNA (adenine1518-N6/adenine1519-N6)-dimethyltransferase
VADAIVRAARLDPARDDVLEVGPGLGVLTERLARAAHRVVAFELDGQLAEWLRTEFPSVEVLAADILQQDIAPLFEADFIVVANLPYHITSPAVRHLLKAHPKRLVIMSQLEVAERIAASPGSLSALSVIVQAQAAARILQRVPAAAFYPKPKVDSAVLLLEPLEQPRAVGPEFEAFVHAGFKQPRKQLANSLADGLQVPKAQALELLEKAGIEPTRRPQELTIGEWVHLFEAS